MKTSFEISKLALKDLDEIWKYSAEQLSQQQANRYYKEISEMIKEICNNPEFGNPIDYISQGHRRLNVRSHMIVYKVKNEIIYIDRILHQKMDIDKNLHE
ncbi:MAG: type II toxin-antitoxin system RelE/ParE family toxin [Saprospiraceae bacterium]|nr:type II toxin-antitoxin system RelE/ParE family toxin [Saprospiraceae bacterium]